MNDRQNGDQRRFPGFLDGWRIANGEDFTPLDFLNQQEGLPFVIAAQWLFAPDFVLYRDGVFRTELPRGLSTHDREILDGWYAELGGEIAEVEKVANRLEFDVAFLACDLTPHDDDLPQLARSVARSWDALLHTRFQDRRFRVEVHDQEKSVSPQVTFFQADPVQDDMRQATEAGGT